MVRTTWKLAALIADRNGVPDLALHGAADRQITRDPGDGILFGT